jgi:uncharacterized cofD-like protein
VDALENADFIILGPGDLFTSIIPNLIVPGVRETIAASSADLIYIINIMTKYGETQNFKCSDFVRHLESFTGRHVDSVVYNATIPGEDLRSLYASQKSEVVQQDFEAPFWGRRQVHRADLLEMSGSVIRHDSEKLASLLAALFQPAEIESDRSDK